MPVDDSEPPLDEPSLDEPSPASEVALVLYDSPVAVALVSDVFVGSASVVSPVAAVVDVDVDGDGLPEIPCPELMIPSDLPSMLFGDLDFLDSSRFEPSCSGAVRREVTFEFTAPATSTYIFETGESSFDTVLYALGPACMGPELACNDDFGGTTASSISLSLQAGETITVVLDGFEQEFGTYSMFVDEAAVCPEITLDPVPEVQVEAVLDEADQDSYTSSCGGSGPDITYAWTPPFTGKYRFTTIGSDFDTVLTVLGQDCFTELACNDDTDGDVSSAVELDLVEGEPIIVGISAFDIDYGGYRLSIFPV